MTRVKLCDEIKDFVLVDSMRGWWTWGVHEKSLNTHCFLVLCSVPQRLGQVLVMSWQANIHEMLRLIPTLSNEGLSAYFDSMIPGLPGMKI